METLDYVRAGAMAIGMLACMAGGKDVWLLADAIIFAASGAACYFFPKQMLANGTEGTLDKYHTYLVQVVGGVNLSMAMASFYSRRSRSNAVHTSQLIARGLMAVMVLQCTLLDYFKAAGDKQRINTNSLYSGMVFYVLLILGNFYYGFKSADHGEFANLRSRVSIHIFIDIILLAFVGMMYYAYPEVMLAFLEGVKPDGIHAHLVRLFGCHNFMSIHLALNALSFKQDGDKRHYLFGRLMTVALVLPIIILYKWKYGFFVDFVYMYPVWISMGVLIVNLVLGYLPKISLPKLKSA